MGGAGYSIVGQFAYLAGHWNNGFASTDHYHYDIVADSWTAVAPVPVAIYRPAAAGVGTQEFLVGGGNPDISASATHQERVAASMRAPATSYTSTYIYDTISNSWTTGPNTNVPHSFTGGTAIGNFMLLVVGGFDGVSGDTNVVERSLVTGPCGSPSPTPTASPTCTPSSFNVLIVFSDLGVPPVMLHDQIAAESGVVAVDYFDAQFNTPTLAQLTPYNIVVAFSNSSYADATAMGNVLADYADTGGVVVGFNFDWFGPPFGLEGRWQTGDTAHSWRAARSTSPTVAWAPTI